MEKIEQLLEDYRIALLLWNDAIRKSQKDISKRKQLTIKYNQQRECLEKLQDFFINQSGDKRYFKRNDDIE